MALITLRSVLALGLLLAVPTLHAATFKCTIDGRTVYRQQACPVDSGGQKLDMRDSRPSGTTLSATDMAQRTKELKEKGPRRLRDAFMDLSGGRADVYVAKLCVRSREPLSRGPMKAQLKSQGDSLRQRSIVLHPNGSEVEGSIARVRLKGIELGPGVQDTSKPPKEVTISAVFEWQVGGLCRHSPQVDA